RTQVRVTPHAQGPGKPLNGSGARLGMRQSTISKGRSPIAPGTSRALTQHVGGMSMPNARIHSRVGAPVGAAYAVACALLEPNGTPLIEGASGYFGGRIGSILPDILEPPSWNHRRTAHSMGAAVLLAASARTIERWAAECRLR